MKSMDTCGHANGQLLPDGEDYILICPDCGKVFNEIIVSSVPEGFEDIFPMQEFMKVVTSSEPEYEQNPSIVLDTFIEIGNNQFTKIGDIKCFQIEQTTNQKDFCITLFNDQKKFTLPIIFPTKENALNYLTELLERCNYGIARLK
jgi:hypothetical protein